MWRTKLVTRCALLGFLFSVMRPSSLSKLFSTSECFLRTVQQCCTMRPMIDVQRLRVFRAVVASGSVQAAAEHLGYTPSAVSQQISALQRETGLVLFEKAGRGIAATAAAK